VIVERNLKGLQCRPDLLDAIVAQPELVLEAEQP
jgi:hypothetical protein